MRLDKSILLVFYSVVFAAFLPYCLAETNTTSHEPVYSISIPEQSAFAAVSELAAISDVSLVAQSQILDGIYTPNIDGEYTVTDALKLMFNNNDVSFAYYENAILLFANESKVITGGTEKKDTEEPTIEVFEVKGFRSNVSRAQAARREADSIAEFIFQDEIALFADLNLGDALQRLPGISSERDNGETRQLTIRGLRPEFSKTQINGVDTLATFSSAWDHRGRAARTRNFDFNLFPAELFTHIVVHKSYKASLDEGGIAATVNLTTPKPFDYSDDQAFISVKAVHNDLSDNTTPRFSTLLSKRGKNAGALLAITWLESDNTESGYRSWSNTPFIHTELNENIREDQRERLNSGELLAPSVLTYSTIGRKQSRLGLSSSIQWFVSDTVSVALDSLYTKISSVDREFQIANQNTRSLRSFAANDSNLVTQASFDQADVRSESRLDISQTEYLLLSLQSKWQLTPFTSLDWQVSHSSSAFDMPIADKVFLQSVDQPISVAFGADSNIPNIEWGFDLTNEKNWQLHRLDSREDSTKHAFTTADLAVDFSLSDTVDIIIGGQFKTFDSSGYSYRDDVRNINALNLDYAVSEFDLGGPQAFVVADVNQTFSLLPQDLLTGRLTGQSFSNELTARSQALSSFAELTEDITGLYIESNIQWQRFKGNLGLRWSSTRSKSAGLVSQDSSPLVNKDTTLLSLSNAYERVLPSINLSYTISDQASVRLSASRNLSRPNLGDLRATTNINIAGNTIEQGNPDLQPFVADNLDIVIDYASSRHRYVSLGLFAKSLKSYIVPESRLVSFAETNLPLDTLTDDRLGQLFTITRPVNGEGGSIHGLELSFQQGFTESTGIIGNFTYVDGSTHYSINNSEIIGPLLGLSRHMFNLSAYMENSKWGLRVSTAFRDRYLTETDAVNQFVGNHASLFIDSSAYYNISEKIKITLEILNITNEAISAFSHPDLEQPLVFTRSGRNMLLGFHFKL
jgi:TonB-dependent receptor